MGKPMEVYTTIGDELNRKNKSEDLNNNFCNATLKKSGKAFSGLFNDEMVFKLEGETHTKALALKGAKLFDPGMGRPMKEWVQVPAKFSDQWMAFAEAAMNYVTSAEKSKPKSK